MREVTQLSDIVQLEESERLLRARPRSRLVDVDDEEDDEVEVVVNVEMLVVLDVDVVVVFLNFAYTEYLEAVYSTEADSILYQTGQLHRHEL